MTKQEKSAINSKKIYNKPKFVRYGAIRELTQAGTMGGNEGTAMSATMMV